MQKLGRREGCPLVRDASVSIMMLTVHGRINAHFYVFKCEILSITKINGV